MTKLIALIVTVCAVTGDTVFAAQRSIPAQGATTANATRATVSRAATNNVAARVANKQSLAQKGNAASRAATNVAARSATTSKSATANTSTTANTASRGSVSNTLSAVSRRIQSAARSIRGRAGTLDGEVKLNGAKGGSSNPNITKITLWVPDDVADAYPKIKAYSQMSGIDKVDGKWPISVLINEDDPKLPELAFLFGNIRDYGGLISGIYTENAQDEANRVYRKDGYVFDANQSPALATNSGNLYMLANVAEETEAVIGICEAEETDLAGLDEGVIEDEYSETEVENVISQNTCSWETVTRDVCAEGDCDHPDCPGIDSPEVRTAMLAVNHIDPDSDKAKHPETWDWQYYRTFKGQEKADQRYCKLMIKHRTSNTCWTNGGVQGEGAMGMRQDGEGNYYYLIDPDSHRYGGEYNHEVYLSMVDCGINSFQSEDQPAWCDSTCKSVFKSIYLVDVSEFPFDCPKEIPTDDSCGIRMHVEFGEKLPSLHNVITKLTPPKYTNSAGRKAPKRFAGIYRYVDGQPKEMYWKADGHPTGKVIVKSNVRSHFEAVWEIPPAPAAEENGCPSVANTWAAWAEYAGGNIGSVLNTSFNSGKGYKIVKGSASNAGTETCAIIYQDKGGLCHIAPWNTKYGYGYGDCTDTKGSPKYACGWVVNCDKSNSDVDRRLTVITNMNGSASNNSSIAVGVTWGEPLPNLGPLISQNSYYYTTQIGFWGGYSQNYMTTGGRPCVRIDHGECIAPSDDFRYWKSDGSPYQPIESEDEITNNFEDGKAYLYWKSANLGLDDCPVVENMSCVGGGNGCKMTSKGAPRKTYPKWWLPDLQLSLVRPVLMFRGYGIIADCGVLTQDGDGLCHMARNGMSCMAGSKTCASRLVSCDRMIATEHNAADDYGLVFDTRVGLYVDDGDGKIYTAARPNGIHSLGFTIYKSKYSNWGHVENEELCPGNVNGEDKSAPNGEWRALAELPDLSTLVSNITNVTGAVAGKHFNGIYSQPNCKGIKYYDASGHPVSEQWKCYGDTKCKRQVCQYRVRNPEQNLNYDKKEYREIDGSAEGELIPRQEISSNCRTSEKNKSKEYCYDSTQGENRTINNMDGNKMYMCWVDAGNGGTSSEVHNCPQHSADMGYETNAFGEMDIGTERGWPTPYCQCDTGYMVASAGSGTYNCVQVESPTYPQHSKSDTTHCEFEDSTNGWCTTGNGFNCTDGDGTWEGCLSYHRRCDARFISDQANNRCIPACEAFLTAHPDNEGRVTATHYCNAYGKDGVTLCSLGNEDEQCRCVAASCGCATGYVKAGNVCVQDVFNGVRPTGVFYNSACTEADNNGSADDSTTWRGCVAPGYKCGSGRYVDNYVENGATVYRCSHPCDAYEHIDGFNASGSCNDVTQCVSQYCKCTTGFHVEGNACVADGASGNDDVDWEETDPDEGGDPIEAEPDDGGGVDEDIADGE